MSKTNFQCAIKMVNLTNLIIQKLNMLAKARKVGYYENIYRQQPESTFIIMPVPSPPPRPAQISRKPTSISAPVTAPKHKSVQPNML